MKKLIGLIAGLIFGATAVAHEQVDFRVAIPDTWKLVSYSTEENLWTYESHDGSHRLMVSVLYYSQETNHSQQGQFLNDFIKTRQEQSSKIETDIQFSETEIKEYEAAWVAKFKESSSKGRFASTKVISSKIGIANFYFESVSSSTFHEEVSDEILATTGFSS
ncbi:hypothetical protein [Shewanella hanedai]|uniref:Chalcone isomerase domain-containing protein n=1 Tax=Shewanella hanedai TaxID=25 RepID=A0A553JUG1_SHEHA|nr:hypothetical protein [Shewanella hanedai]TRY16093.1 hypothetical protein FN961_00200 [Shewanella hanedai]